MHAAAPSATNGRVAPSIFQHDYLVLRLLHRDLVRALASLPARAMERRVAIDVGAGGGPYRGLLEKAGFAIKGLDIAPGPGVDIVGTAERTGLPDESADLVLCTQVLEHTRAPWLAMREFARILRPGGRVVISVPHVWFYHPHPHDYWRVTAEGMAALFEEGGLRMVSVVPQGGSAATLFQVLNFLMFGVLGRAGAPLYALGNLLGRGADALTGDARFALNHVGVGCRGDDGRTEDTRT